MIRTWANGAQLSESLCRINLEKALSEIWGFLNYIFWFTGIIYVLWPKKEITFSELFLSVNKTVWNMVCKNKRKSSAHTHTKKKSLYQHEHGAGKLDSIIFHISFLFQAMSISKTVFLCFLFCFSKSLKITIRKKCTPKEI